MPKHYSDETLMAFADGLLDEPLFSSVAEALERDPTIAERLEQLVSGASLAREGFAPLLKPASPELEASVRAMIARKQQKPLWNGRFNLAWLFPLAGVAAVVTVVAVAVPLLQPSGVSVLNGLSNAELQAALGTLPSGENQTLADGRNLHAVATFTAADGTLCREFEVPGYVMVACRSAAEWQVSMAVAIGAGEGYQAASGLGALDSYLVEIGASAPLLDAQEREVLTALPSKRD